MSNTRTILIIDDEATIRENVAEYLEEFGFKSITAENGVNGIQLILEHKPHLILCDIDMPGINGYEVFKQAQQIPEFSIIPFIFLTAKASPEELREGMQLGADDYITKPFKLSDILHSINRRLEKASRIIELSEKKLTALTENNIIGIFFYQNEGFTYTNKVFQNFTGYPDHELTGIRFDALLSGNKSKIYLEKFNACLNGSVDSLTLETYLKTKNGEEKPVIISMNHLIVDNQNTLVGLSQFSEVKKENGISLNEAFSGIIAHLKLEERTELATGLEKFKEQNSIQLAKNSITSNLKIKVSERETEILSMICKGYTNSEIASQLYLSIRTIENHRANLLTKTKSKNTAQLVSFGIKYLNIDV